MAEISNSSVHPEHRGDRNPARNRPLKKEAEKNLKNAKSVARGHAKKSIQQANTVTDGEDG